MEHPNRTPSLRALPMLAALGFLLAPAAAQVIYYEAETVANANDTFAQAEDCTSLGNNFVIKAKVHQGNTYSDDEWYKFNAAAGACINIDVNITQPATAGQYQMNVWLFNSSQTMVAAWNTVSASSSASIGIGAYTAPSADTYYIYMTEWSVAPNALSQPGLTFTPLSVRGYRVNGATPNSTRNTAGGNQTFNSLYEITVRVSNGNEGPFDVFLDRNPTTGAIVASPSTANVCSLPPAATNVRFLASAKCPAGGVNVNIAGGTAGPALPGVPLTLLTLGPEVSTTYTVDIGGGPQPGGTLVAVQTLVTRNTQTIYRSDVCAGAPVCFDVCAPGTSQFFVVLSETLGPPIPIPPFITPLDLDTTSFLFNSTFPVNLLSPILTGAQGSPGAQQVCFALPPGVITSQIPIYMQVASFGASGLTGLSPRVTLTLVP